ncbi:MAG: hypothetical protein BECKG1743D_GA0114223_109181 [Candidatus Kentron sp. G]|nr:MAG: hypothetical protein BECKG1743E_GA0114224_104862 [Candidatus Kentron sp. G]VFN03896.1 MAG: hypothetical protein BECKG1743F_GA0114225_108631 [Candidatus Kentron sp. G]VFN06796.1 MAG: hypothetical protein BECKG1743D_GA0114223_109181 [Candidatus Kentron sp. G]
MAFAYNSKYFAIRVNYFLLCALPPLGFQYRPAFKLFSKSEKWPVRSICWLENFLT